MTGVFEIINFSNPATVTSMEKAVFNEFLGILNLPLMSLTKTSTLESAHTLICALSIGELSS